MKPEQSDLPARAYELKQAIKTYDGPSMATGDRIIVVTTNLRRASKNAKTGHMAQTFIMPYAEAPHVAVKTGLDRSVCGDCGLRPMLHSPGEVSTEPCYVVTFHGPRSVWSAYRDEPVTPLDEAREILASARFPSQRLGSWGDPGVVPAWVWSVYPLDLHTGYTHQWEARPDLASLCMASVHTTAERDKARAMGFRTFRVISDLSEMMTGEILCPASKEAGARTQCSYCSLCDGSRGTGDRRKDIAIIAH
jgi:hypothetical protein